MTDTLFERGLPSNLNAERFVLGSILLNDLIYVQVAGAIEPDDFSLEKHRRIFARMKDLYDRGERVDRVTVANELDRQGQLQSVDGLGYIVSLDKGIPEIANIESYIRIVREKATLRKTMFACQRIMEQCAQSTEPSEENSPDGGEPPGGDWRSERHAWHLGYAVAGLRAGPGRTITPDSAPDRACTPWAQSHRVKAPRRGTN
jgi:hypothetical protein